MKRIFVLYVVLSICAAAFSQIKFPEIKWKSDSLIFIREKEALRYGVETFGDGLYVDSLIHYLDTICHVEPQVDNSVSDSIFQAVWNNDTLTYRVRSKIYRGYDYDSKSKKKLRNLVVESRIPVFRSASRYKEDYQYFGSYSFPPFLCGGTVPSVFLVESGRFLFRVRSCPAGRRNRLSGGRRYSPDDKKKESDIRSDRQFGEKRFLFLRCGRPLCIGAVAGGEDF